MSELYKSKVFITHSWRDIEFARRIYKDLYDHGFEVWLDDRAVQAGERFAGAIDRGLEWCDVYIPVLSYASLDSPWCREEIEAAISLSNEQGRNGRPRIIPLLIENCQDRMPALLRARLFVNFTSGYDLAFKELLTKGFGSSHPAGRDNKQGGARPYKTEPITYAPKDYEQIQCPKCGNFKLKSARSYLERSTGKPSRVSENPVLMIFGAIFSAFWIAVVAGGILDLDTEISVFIGFIAFIVTYSIVDNERRKMIAGKSKKVITINNYECKNCGFHWQIER